MRVIVFHSPKGGVGRTVTCIALARALQQRGLRVHVMDASDHYDDGSAALTGWDDRTAKYDPHDVHPIRVTVASNAWPLLDVLEAKARQESACDCDVVLIDTAKNLDDRSRIALRAADLVLAPFRTYDEATAIAKRLSRSVLRPAPIRGLFLGFDGEFPEARGMASEKMRDYPPFEHEMLFDRDLFSALLMGEMPVSPSGLIDDAEKWKDWPLVEALAGYVMEMQATHMG